MALQVYGIPNCGTCKKAFAWLENHNIDYEFIDTKVNPPDQEQITQWVSELGFKPMRNTSGQAYRALGDEKQAWGDPEWISSFSENAMLLKRPLFVKDGKAVLVGFRAKEEVLQDVLES